MKINYLALLCTIIFSITAAPNTIGQDGGDWVKKFLYAAFNVPKLYDEMQKYEKNCKDLSLSSKNSSAIEVNKNYRRVSHHYHPDKNTEVIEKIRQNNQKIVPLPAQTDPLFSVAKMSNERLMQENEQLKQKAQEEQQKINTLYALFKDQALKNRYDGMLDCIDIYSKLVKVFGSAFALYWLYALYSTWSYYADKAPKHQLKKLKKFVHKSIESLINRSYNRNDDAEKKLLISTGFPITALTGVSEKSAQVLQYAIFNMDLQLKEAYEKITWQYYDCVGIDELRIRDPQMIVNLENASVVLNAAVDVCRQEISNLQHKKDPFKKWTILCCATCAAGLGGMFGNWLMKRQVSKFMAPKDQNDTQATLAGLPH